MTWSFPDKTIGLKEALYSLKEDKLIEPRALAILESAEKAGASIGVACSGGGDSTLLAFLIINLFPNLLHRTHICHFNHNLRGIDSKKDETFVEELAKNLGLNFITGISRGINANDEASLRNERMDFFKKISQKNEFNYILLGHHADDVAETMLWRLARTSTLDGIVSPRPIIKHQTLMYVRPLLNLGRAEIHKVLTSHKIPWREDQSNHNKRYLRNRLRSKVIPHWKSCLDQDLLKGVSQSRTLLEQDLDAINHYTALAFTACAHGKNLKVEKFNSFPMAIRRRVLRLWLSKKNKQNFSFNGRESHIIQQIEELTLSDSDISGGVRLEINDNLLIQKEISKRETSFGLVCLPFDQNIFLPNGKKISAKKCSLSKEKKAMILRKQVKQAREAYLSIQEDEFFWLRHREMGDRFHPLGSDGSKKVGKLMTNAKWTTDKKNQTPVITNSDQEIIWIPGFPPSEFLKITDSSRRVIHLTYD
ncbi:MAG: tRNA lysidine(34) synthetase TilS [Verrucomicrobia bacterium TMED44]|nr:MAG: tRNA lysidine(34) synthetase TilS [Verrucomicrobia bacterium TMED44]